MTGMELWGHGDNATFLHDATEDYRRKPTESLSRARWRRVVWRWGLIGVPTLLITTWGLARATVYTWTLFKADPPAWAMLSWGWIIFAYVAAGGIAAVTFSGASFASWWAVREVRSTYIYPAADVLARVTGVRLRRRDKLAAIELPEGFGKEVDADAEPEPVRVYVPEIVLDDAMKRRIANAVGGRIGLPEPIAKWTESGVPQRYVDLYPMALPPKSVSIDDLLEELLAGDIDHPLVGVMNGSRVSRMDFVNDSPHTLGSAGSGAGKSTLYKLIAMQLLRHGGYAMILDFKKWSHLRWAGRLPAGRVVIEDEVGRISDALAKLLDELIWRKSFDLKDEAKLATLPRIDVFVEEINTLIPLLMDYWTAYMADRKVRARIRVRKAKEEIRDSGAARDEIPDHLLAELEEAEEELVQALSLPKKSPAVQAIRYGVNLGREFRIHFHFIGQSMDAQAAGGRNTRESFRTRLLARWDAKTWKMLADGIPYVACPSGDVGIWAHVHNGTYEIVRVPYVPDAWAVQYVLDGVRPSLPMFHGDPVPTIEAEPATRTLGASMPLSEIVSILPIKADGSTMTIKALRLAAGRDGFPEPVVKAEPGKAALFDPEEVLAWYRDREGIPALGS